MIDLRVSCAFVCSSGFGAMFWLPTHLGAAERIYTAYFSPAPGGSAIIWVAKEVRLFEKHGLDVAPVLIPSSVRTPQAILAGESAIDRERRSRCCQRPAARGSCREMASANPKAATLNAKDLVDARFVKELEDSGFVAGLIKK